MQNAVVHRFVVTPTTCSGDLSMKHIPEQTLMRAAPKRRLRLQGVTYRRQSNRHYDLQARLYDTRSGGSLNRETHVPPRRGGDWGLIVMDSALQKVADLLGSGASHSLRTCFARIAMMPGARGLFRRIVSAAGVEDLRDYLAEARYALLFAGLEFEVAIEPHGRKGPDLSISRDGEITLVEVTRFRTVHVGPLAASTGDLPEILPVYGDPLRDIRKARAKVQGKFGQLLSGAGIIAIWNDDGDLEELEMREAVRELIADASSGAHSLPAGLELVLYGSEFWNAGRQQQFYLFPVREASQESGGSWQAVLEASTADELIRRAVNRGARPTTGTGPPL